MLRSHIFFILLLFTACNPVIEIPGFTPSAWQEERLACGGKGPELTQPLLENKSKLYGLDEEQVIGLLGKPDQRELYERNQKFFLYHLSGINCNPGSQVQQLSIRFNSLGKCSEVLILQSDASS